MKAYSTVPFVAIEARLIKKNMLWALQAFGGVVWLLGTINWLQRESAFWSARSLIETIQVLGSRVENNERIEDDSEELLTGWR